jgi:hypothetical protein
MPVQTLEELLASPRWAQQLRRDAKRAPVRTDGRTLDVPGTLLRGVSSLFMPTCALSAHPRVELALRFVERAIG